MPTVVRRNPVCGLAALTLGLLALDHTLTTSHAELLQCKESFYRHTPPHAVAGSGLEKRCHRLTDGRSFASLYHPGCQAQVYTALHLGQNNRWGQGAEEEKDESSSGKEDSNVDSHAFVVPALYKKDRKAALSTPASPLQKLDSLAAELVASRTVPKCSEAGGDVFVQSGVGGLSDCEAGVLWSAVCCAVPDGGGSFNMGAVREGEEGLKVMSVEELEKLVGIDELFPGGCGGQGVEGEAVTVSKEAPESIQERHTGDRSEEGAEMTESNPELEDSDSDSDSESDSGSVLLYVLSTSFSLLYAPISPVISTLTSFPSQLCYVLQEDAAVLAELPSDSLSLVQNLGAGAASGVGNVGSVLYWVGETTLGSLYTCLSTLAGTLLLSCQEGVAGTGTLACDALGLVTGALQQGWDLGTTMAKSTGQNALDYLGAVGSELNQQVMKAGGGVGTLVWRGQRGVGHVFNTVGAILGGVVENTVENVQEAISGE